MNTDKSIKPRYEFITYDGQTITSRTITRQQVGAISPQSVDYFLSPAFGIWGFRTKTGEWIEHCDGDWQGIGDTCIKIIQALQLNPGEFLTPVEIADLTGFFSLRNGANKLEFKIGRNRLHQNLDAAGFDVDRKLVLTSIHRELVMTKSNRSFGSLNGDLVYVIVAPLYIHFDLIGILYLQSSQPILSSSNPKWKMFQLFLDHTALAIRNSQYYKVCRDAEKEKHDLEKSLIQSDSLAMKGTLAAKIGHEINNYLSGIHANIEMAMEFMQENKNNNAIVERLEKAREMIMNMASLSNGLMAKSAVDPNIEKSSINQVVNKFVDFVKPIYKYSDVVIEKELSLSIPDVHIDSGLMIQLLFNIVKNAVEARSDARITIKTFYDRETKHVKIDIGDNGPGMSEDVQSKIFDIKYTNKADGHGYGLAICQDIAKKHGGSIKVQSKLKQGTSFCISLPINIEEDFADVEFDRLELLEEQKVRQRKIKQKSKKVVRKKRPRSALDYHLQANDTLMV